MNLLNLKRLESIASASLGYVAINVWDRTPQVEDAQAVADVWSSVARAHPGLIILAVIGSECSVPDNAVRDVLTREVKRIKKQLLMVANVVEGVGFGAAALRGAVTGMTVLIQPSYPVKTFGTVAESAVFLAKNGAATAAEINEAVRVMRTPSA